eukprot:5916259-Pleurochrysis_carterae.AAC.1
MDRTGFNLSPNNFKDQGPSVPLRFAFILASNGLLDRPTTKALMREHSKHVHICRLCRLSPEPLLAACKRDIRAFYDKPRRLAGRLLGCCKELDFR